jgi:xylulokinase
MKARACDVKDSMYLLGLDVGTTGCKAVIFTPSGELVSDAYGEYRLYHRRPEWSELNPEEVWKAVMSTIRSSVQNAKVNPGQIAALSTSVLGEAFFPIDRNGRPLYWSMTTFDARPVGGRRTSERTRCTGSQGNH